MTGPLLTQPQRVKPGRGRMDSEKQFRLRSQIRNCGVQSSLNVKSKEFISCILMTIILSFIENCAIKE